MHYHPVVSWDVYFTELAEQWLLGGDKTDDWTGRYERNIPIADDRYDLHLKEELN
jgi:hypothetical protein